MWPISTTIHALLRGDDDGQLLWVPNVPIGTLDFVHAYVRAKAVEIGNDVQKLSIITDPKIHYDLLRFCQHTRLGFLGRNLPPEVMMT